jgi:hypothetical protein
MPVILLLIGCLYLIWFFWFRSLCRAAIRFHQSTLEPTHVSNLIPFERGLEMRAHKF